MPLVKAVQELSKENDSLKNELADIKKMVLQIQQQQSYNTTTSNSMQQNNMTIVNTASLEQNIPNPFTNTTTIGYYLPQ